MKNIVTRRRPTNDDSSLKNVKELSKPNKAKSRASGMKPITVFSLCFIPFFICSNFYFSGFGDAPATSTHSTPIIQKEPTTSSTENHLRSKKQRSKTFFKSEPTMESKATLALTKLFWTMSSSREYLWKEELLFHRHQPVRKNNSWLWGTSSHRNCVSFKRSGCRHAA